MKKWFSGRIVCLDEVGLREQDAVSAGFEIVESQRIEYMNYNMGFACLVSGEDSRSNL